MHTFTTTTTNFHGIQTHGNKAWQIYITLGEVHMCVFVSSITHGSHFIYLHCWSLGMDVILPHSLLDMWLLIHAGI